MHKNAQKQERKTQTKICCHYTWLLHGKNYPSRWCFLRSFLTPSKPSRRSITTAKRKEKEKIVKPEDVGHFLVQNFDFSSGMPESKCRKTQCQSVARKASCRVANAFSTRLKLIWPRSSLKITKMSKKRIFAKSSRRQWANCQNLGSLHRTKQKLAPYA